MKKNTKSLLWKNSTPKIKHETLCNDYKAGELKIVNILKKIIVLQWSWIRRLYDNLFHQWKFVSLCLIKKLFAPSFKFYSNLLLKSNKTKFFPSFCRETILNRKKHLVMMTDIPSCIFSQYLWYIESIQVDKASLHVLRFSKKQYQLCFATFPMAYF